MRSWVLLLLLPLAGCLDGPSDALDVHVPISVDAVGFYALDHGGGTVTVTAAKDAVVGLYGADDIRIGQAHLRPGQGVAVFPGVAAGPVVLHVASLNATVAVEAPGAQGLRPLVAHMERVVLVDRAPREGLTDFLRLGSEPVRAEIDVVLQRPPNALFVLSGGGHEGLQVIARSEVGLVLEANPPPRVAGSMLTGHRLDPLAADVFPANIGGGRLAVEVHADHLDGALLLEAWSYSRAAPRAAPTSMEGELVFDHGSTDGRPVRVGLHAKATLLGLQNDDEGNATVAVLGPGDERIGVYRVAPNSTVRVPVGGGEHVVAPLTGDVRVLVDRVPQDFEMHPLETTEQVYPRRAVGDSGRYGQRSTEVEVDGVVFDAQAAPSSGGGLFPCHRGASTRLMADGETIGVWSGGHASEPFEVARRLAGDLSVVMDGIGADCDGPAVRLVAYVR